MRSTLECNTLWVDSKLIDSTYVVPVVPQVFGSKAFAKLGKWFISLHFSDHPGYRKKNLTFKFVLPDANDMSDLAKLITLIPYYIDLVGRYKLSSHVSKLCSSRNLL